MKPKISIIIPVYGVEKYIGKCIDSVLNQTTKELEIIVIDDKTPDKSIEVVEDKIKGHWREKQFRIIKKEQNEGVAFARKTGQDLAKGEYIHFIDTDDYYTSNYVLEKMYNKAKEENADLIVGNYNEEYTNKTRRIKKNIPNNITKEEYIKGIVTSKYGKKQQNNANKILN